MNDTGINLTDFAITINPLILAALIGIVEYMKKHKVKSNDKYGSIFIILCILIGFCLSLLDSKFDVIIIGIAQSIIYTILYFGIGTLAYQLPIVFTKSLVEKYKNNSGAGDEK